MDGPNRTSPPRKFPAAETLNYVYIPRLTYTVTLGFGHYVKLKRSVSLMNCRSPATGFAPNVNAISFVRVSVQYQSIASLQNFTCWPQCLFNVRHLSRHTYQQPLFRSAGWRDGDWALLALRRAPPVGLAGPRPAACRVDRGWAGRPRNHPITQTTDQTLKSAEPLDRWVGRRPRNCLRKIKNVF